MTTLKIWYAILLQINLLPSGHYDIYVRLLLFRKHPKCMDNSSFVYIYLPFIELPVECMYENRQNSLYDTTKVTSSVFGPENSKVPYMTLLK